jgi:hypothetical protein
MRLGSKTIVQWGGAAGAALLTFACIAAGNAATIVGTTGAANTQATAIPPGGALRTIEIGAEMVENEKIETSASGSVQLLFIDKTTLNIGPHSSVVIDKFVFNPMTTQGELAVTLSKGALRLVGGQATHTGGGTITTPDATIGVRGGIVTASHTKEKGTQAFLGFGKMTVTSFCKSGGDCTPQTVTVTRPGFMVQIDAANGTPTQPVKASAALIDQSNVQLTSKTGQSGGSSVAPTDQQAATFNVGTTNSTATPQVTVTQMQGRVASTSSNYQIQQAQQTSQQGTQNQTAAVAAQSASPPSPPPPPPQQQSPPPPTPAPVTAYSIVTVPPYSTSLGRSAAPYLVGNFVTSGGVSHISPILGYGAGGLFNGATDVTSRQFQAGLRVSGQGAAQTSTFGVMTSEITRAPNIGFTQAGGFSAQNAGSPSPGTYYFSGGAVGSATSGSAVNSVPTNQFGKPTGAYSLASYAINLDTGSVTPASAYAAGVQENYTFTVPTATPTTLTPNHPAQSLQGYVGGVMQTWFYSSAGAPTGVFGAPYVVTNASGQPGSVNIYLPATSSQMGAVFNVASLNNPSSANIATPLAQAQYNFGSYNPSDPTNSAGLDEARGAYVDPANFAGRAQAVFNNGANVPTTQINGTALNGVNQYADTFMVTATPVGANTTAFLTAISSTTVTPCACDYTQWGFWSTNTGRSLNGGVSTYGDYSTAPMLWVAGAPTAAGNIPTTGTATYTGHVIADINNGGATYLAAGTFSNAVNFGTRTGAVQIGGLDGSNYTGGVAFAPSSTYFAGGLTGSVAGRAAVLTGSIFQGGPTNSTPLYGEMGGAIILNGPNYLGSGIFAARKP